MAKVKIIRKRRKMKKDKKQDKQIRKLIQDNKADDGYKFIEVTGQLTTLYSAMTINQQAHIINALSQGAGQQQRVGDTIINKYVTIKLHLDTVATEGAGHLFHPFRVMLFWDKHPTGNSYPVRERLFQAQGSDVNAYLGPLNKDFIKTDFKVLYDRTFPFNSQTGFWDTALPAYIPLNTQKILTIRKKLKDVKTQYIKGTTTGNPQDFATNALWLIIFSRYNDGVAFNVNYRFDYSQ